MIQKPHVRLGLQLLFMVLVLVALHAVIMACYLNAVCLAPQAFLFDVGYLFDLNKESNIPNWISTSLMLVVAITLAFIARVEKERGARHVPWALLAALFVYMSMDEATDFHGLWARLVDAEALMGKANAGFAWLIPGAFVVAAVGLLSLRWLLTLPAPTRVTFILAGIIYVTGALGFEFLGSRVVDETFYNPAYLVVAAIEEALEMCGIIVMLVGSLAHLDALWSADVVA